MAIAVIENEVCGLALELSGKGTTLLGHQTPLSGEHSRLNGCPVLLGHYSVFRSVPIFFCKSHCQIARVFNLPIQPNHWTPGGQAESSEMAVAMSKLIVVLLLFVPAVYATEPTAVSPDPYGGFDKRPEKSENLTRVLNEDGTWTTSMVMTDGDGYQEDCIIKMSQATKEQPIPKPIGKACTRIRFSLPN